MIVDDTITYRTILRSIVENIPNTKVVASVANGKIALEKLQNFQVDLVLLDIEMPEMDGLETLTHIRAKHPHTKIVMVSGMNKHSADITIRALELGALDFIPKPQSESMKENTQALTGQLAEVFQQFVQRKPLAATRSIPPRPSPTTTTTRAKLQKVDVIAVGASTGGPNALTEFLSALPDNLNVPILLVQHMPPVFTASLASNLAKKCALHVKEAEDQEVVKENTVYIAPGGRHMTVQRDKTEHVKIVLTDEAPENSCRPAVDVLFRSIATTYKKNILSVILTGMGSDGALGVKALKEVGCYSLAQSEKTCVVYGMPQAVVNMQLADEIVDLELMAHKVTQIVQRI